MQTIDEKTTEVTVTSVIQNAIASLPEGQAQRSDVLDALEAELQHNLQSVRGEQRKLMRSAIEQNMNPNEKMLTEIANRYALSSAYGVNRDDFDTVLAEISANEKVLTQLRCLKATGAEMTITSIDASEVLFIDTVDDVNVKAQEEFLSGLDEKERSDAVSTLQERFPEIEQLLKRADGERGLHYYDYLLICEVTGAEPMPEDKYRELQRHKPVDRRTICWLLAEQEMLDRGVALRGRRGGLGVNVYGYNAAFRSSVRAGRPLLRVQRAA